MRTRRHQPEGEGDAPELALPPHGTAPPPQQADERMPCPGCRAPTPQRELAQLGNRCSSCYAAFCQAASTQQRPLLADRKLDSLGWARAIVERHRMGGHVTPAQLQMAKDALAVRTFTSSEDEA